MKDTRHDVAFSLLQQALQQLRNAPASRGNSLAITNLEQAIMWIEYADMYG